jgi:hypothetical protein
VNKILLEIIQLQIVQIILVAYVGALLGEMKKEIDDEDSIVLSKFVIAWMSSGFGGVMIGLILQGTVAKDNNYIVLSGSGIAGYVGQKKSIGIAAKFLNGIINPDEQSTKKKTTKKRNTTTKKRAAKKKVDKSENDNT